MKLTTGLLLVTLMLCCYSAADAEVCPRLVHVLTMFLGAPHDDYMKEIAPFAPTDVMKEAASQLKQCALGLPLEYRKAKGEVLKNILAKCPEAVPQI